MGEVRMYYSGSVTRPRCEKYIVDNRLYRLVSFAYKKDVEKYIKWARMWGWENPHVLLDSGAFTAWSKGDQINREDLLNYAKYLQDDGIDLLLINLDRIPGEKGRDPTANELEEAIHESHTNHIYFAERLGMDKVLPVFHQGEDTAVLHEILATGAPYICISPRNDLHERFRITWCNHAMQQIPSSIKVHGLATTGEAMMRSNTWFSVDSATYIMVAAYGRIWTPSGKILPISADSQQVKEMSQHFDNISPIEQEAITAAIESHGFTIEQLRTDHEARALWNVMFWHLNPITPTQHQIQGLFS